MQELWLILALGVAALYLQNSMAAKELARTHGRRACQQAGVGFLDDTVALKKIRMSRHARGWVILKRDYLFEFTVDGRQRYGGEIEVRGGQITRLKMTDPAAPFHQPNC